MSEIKQFINGFELIRKINQGGFGTVYLSKDRKGKYVALKLLKKSDALQEITFLKMPNKNLKECSSHNIIPILDAYESTDEVILIMPLADSLYPVYSPENPLWKEKSLSNLIKEKEENPSSEWFSEKEVFDIAKSLFNAVMFLNDAEVLHRDIKPSNVLFWNGKACLIDFSISQKDENFENIKELGTDFYKAPQGYIAKGGNPDMWSLAATLFKVITGNPITFVGRASTIYPKRKIGNFSEAQKERYQHWRRCILRAISENPQQRFIRIKDFRDVFFSDDFSMSKLADMPVEALNSSHIKISTEIEEIVKMLDIEFKDKGMVSVAEIEKFLRNNKIEPNEDIVSKLLNVVESKNAILKNAVEIHDAAMEFIEQKDFENAIKCFDILIRSEPSAESFAYRGMCKFEKKEYHHAIADFEKAISVDKNLAMAYHGMASCYSNLAELQQKHREDPMSKELEVEYIKLSMLNMVKARDLGDPQAEKVIDSLKAKGLFKEE